VATKPSRHIGLVITSQKQKRTAISARLNHSRCFMSAPARPFAPVLRASMTATSGRSAAERLPIPMAATIAGITDMPNDRAGGQGRCSTARASAVQDIPETHNAAPAEYNRQAALHLVLEIAIPQYEFVRPGGFPGFRKMQKIFRLTDPRRSPPRFAESRRLEHVVFDWNRD
jgi:hypothetical protein